MDINFKWIGGATWILQIDKLKIACDPVLCPKGHIQDYGFFKTERLNDPVFDENDFQNVNLWLLTHNHEDHIDSYGFKMIDKNSSTVSHKSLKSLFKNDSRYKTRFSDWYERFLFSSNGIDITITTLPAIHARRKIFSRVIGNGNGYLLEIKKDDEKYCVYITGDSVFNKNILTNLSNSSIDLLIANAGSAKIGKSFLSILIGRITNNTEDIIRMIEILKPKLLIPVHWGTFSHYSELINSVSFREYSNARIVDIGQTIKLK